MKPLYKVLVCDDLPMIRRTVRLSFGKAPDFCVVDEAVNGREAVTKALGMKPDLILMDVRMPELNGVEATRQIHEEAPDVKVLAFSSDSSWETVDLMLSAGATGYVVKGADQDELIRASRTTMAGGHYLSPVLLEPSGLER